MPRKQRTEGSNTTPQNISILALYLVGNTRLAFVVRNSIVADVFLFKKNHFLMVKNFTLGEQSYTTTRSLRTQFKGSNRSTHSPLRRRLLFFLEHAACVPCLRVLPRLRIKEFKTFQSGEGSGSYAFSWVWEPCLGFSACLKVRLIGMCRVVALALTTRVGERFLAVLAKVTLKWYL